MSLGKLSEKLVRDAKRSPVKAAFLLSLVPVAMYFWLPLITKNFQGKATTPAPDAPVNVAPGSSTQFISTTTPVATPTSTTPAASAEPTWQELLKWRALDSLTKGLAPADTERDPFREYVMEVVAGLPEDEATTGVPADVTLKPEELPLTLTATLVGSRSRSATINGFVRREGDRFAIDGSDMTSEHEEDDNRRVELIEIQPQSVVMEFRKQRFELALPQGSKVKTNKK